MQEPCLSYVSHTGNKVQCSTDLIHMWARMPHTSFWRGLRQHNTPPAELKHFQCKHKSSFEFITSLETWQYLGFVKSNILMGKKTKQKKHCMFACMQKAVLKLKAKLKWSIQFACLNLKQSFGLFCPRTRKSSHLKTKRHRLNKKSNLRKGAMGRAGKADIVQIPLYLPPR